MYQKTVKSSWLGLKKMLTAFRQKGKFFSSCPDYNTKPSDGEAPFLELWRIWSTFSLSLLFSSLLTGMLVHVQVSIELLVLNSNSWNHWSVCKQEPQTHLKRVLPTNYLLTNHICNIYIYNQNLLLNCPQGLIGYRTQSNQNRRISAWPSLLTATSGTCFLTKRLLPFHAMDCLFVLGIKWQTCLVQLKVLFRLKPASL